mgnify:CR=1 FL=1
MDKFRAIEYFVCAARDGSLTQIGSFLTGGTGQLNVPKRVGPDDGGPHVAQLGAVAHLVAEAVNAVEVGIGGIGERAVRVEQALATCRRDDRAEAKVALEHARSRWVGRQLVDGQRRERRR